MKWWILCICTLLYPNHYFRIHGILLSSIIGKIVVSCWSENFVLSYEIHMTVNARWQSRRPRYRAVAPVTSYMFLNGEIWRHRSDSSVAGTRAIEIRYVNGSSVAGTTALSPGVHRHMLGVKFEKNKTLRFISIKKASFSEEKDFH